MLLTIPVPVRAVILSGIVSFIVMNDTKIYYAIDVKFGLYLNVHYFVLSLFMSSVATTGL
jgi:hypothetical protein